ncbi:MAG: polysaccharide biosynthesis/export family protein [Thiohalocapsa sp.]|nr:polysaccharide biosynthesis/export family protein [Thiohalocapsa sp.]
MNRLLSVLLCTALCGCQASMDATTRNGAAAADGATVGEAAAQEQDTRTAAVGASAGEPAARDADTRRETAAGAPGAPGTAPAEQQRSAAAPGDTGAASAPKAAYRLGPGDKVRVTIYGDPYLSGEFRVTTDGKISLALIEPVDIADLTVPEAEAAIAEALAGAFIGEPKVSVDILEYRPFYIMGAVQNPGGYPYVAEMTVLHAISIAGGFTPDASKSRILIQRDGETGIRAGSTTPVQPGDVITVKERFF